MARTLRRIPLLAATLLGGVLVCGSASAEQQIAVIVAQNSPDLKLNITTLRDIYLKKIFLDDHDRELIPLNLPADHALRRAFSLDLFNKGAQELQNYWNQRYFHGITPPYVLGSPQAVVQFVAKTPGAIGYVTPCDLDPRVKQVLSLPVPPAEHAALEKLCPSSSAASQPVTAE
jgi:ABC-type phosphate transport system substrate-binding protein